MTHEEDCRTCRYWGDIKAANPACGGCEDGSRWQSRPTPQADGDDGDDGEVRYDSLTVEELAKKLSNDLERLLPDKLVIKRRSLEIAESLRGVKVLK